MDHHQLDVYKSFISWILLIKSSYCAGVLKAVNGGEVYDYNRITKDVVAFQAGDFYELVEKLQLDLHEPPISQVG